MPPPLLSSRYIASRALARGSVDLCAAGVGQRDGWSNVGGYGAVIVGADEVSGDGRGGSV